MISLEVVNPQVPAKVSSAVAPVKPIQSGLEKRDTPFLFSVAEFGSTPQETYTVTAEASGAAKATAQVGHEAEPAERATYSSFITQDSNVGVLAPP